MCFFFWAVVFGYVISKFPKIAYISCWYYLLEAWFILAMLIFQMFSLSWSISPGTDCNINCGEVQSVPWFWGQGDKPVVTSTLSFISLLVFIFSEWSVRIPPHHFHLFTCPPYFWFHYSIPVIQRTQLYKSPGGWMHHSFQYKIRALFLSCFHYHS